ncbi:HNH endonuclease [Escherichia coli]|uniref:HNH endonuclease n=1 Tax=Escherichia coli TaxID=562 RepID=UPI000BE2A0DA|nr:HNH endonuclease [Escherichia coli]EFM1881934.1 HNH endonuclease [Escherichia coli]
MRNEIKYQHIKRLWCLKDGVIFTRWGNKPVSFSCKVNGRRYTTIKVNGKWHAVLIYEAIFMLFHDRPIAEGKEIHHKDGDPENNAIDNLVELTRTQHKRIHQYQCNDPLRGICLNQGAWEFKWYDDNGICRSRRFHSINEAINFRAEIEKPRRRELRLLGLNCRKKYRGITASQLRKISRKQNSRLWRTHI